MAEVSLSLRTTLHDVREALAADNAWFEERYREKVLGKEKVSNPARLHKVKKAIEGLRDSAGGPGPLQGKGCQ